MDDPARNAPAFEICRVLEQRLRIDAHETPQNVLADDRLGDNAPAAREKHVDARVLLVGVHVAGEDVSRAARIGLRNPLARRERGFADHVLSGGVAGRVVESQVSQRPDGELLDPDQLADAGRGFRLLFDRREIVVDPAAEHARASRVLEDEHRRALHGAFDDRRLHPAAFRQQPHASIVARDQRPLGRRERHEEIALRVLSVNPKRAGDANRHLSRADEVFDVPLKERRIERIFRDVREIDARHLANERAPAFCAPMRVIIDRVARNRPPLRRGPVVGHPVPSSVVAAALGLADKQRLRNLSACRHESTDAGQADRFDDPVRLSASGATFNACV